MDKSDVAHRLLDVLGERLLSNNEHNNMLAEILKEDKGSLDGFKENLKTLLKPFADQNSELKGEINSFIKKVLNTVHSLKTKANLVWNDIKAILPTIQIFCKQLIDRVKCVR